MAKGRIGTKVCKKCGAIFPDEKGLAIHEQYFPHDKDK